MREQLSVLWARICRWPWTDQPARALASSLSSQPAGLVPTSSVSLVAAPPAIMVQTFMHAGKRFEHLSEERQEQAQQELYQRLKASQIARGIFRMGSDQYTELALSDDQP